MIITIPIIVILVGIIVLQARRIKRWQRNYFDLLNSKYNHLNEDL